MIQAITSFHWAAEVRIRKGAGSKQSPWVSDPKALGSGEDEEARDHFIATCYVINDLMTFWEAKEPFMASESMTPVES